MAKKSKKTVNKAVKKATKKTGKKAGSKAKKKAAAGGNGPKPIKLGRGTSFAEIGAAVVANINAGRPDKVVWDKYWSPKIVSVEGGPGPMVWNGRKAIEAKCEWWYGAHTVHGMSAEGPYIGATGFAIKYRMDIEDKATGERTLGEEIGVYTVENGKVVREEFMYGSRETVSTQWEGMAQIRA